MKTSSLTARQLHRPGALVALLGAAGVARAESVVCTEACTVTHVVTLAPGDVSDERVSDYNALFYAFLTAVVLVLCARAIYSYFKLDHES